MGGIDLCFGRWDDDLHRLFSLCLIRRNIKFYFYYYRLYDLGRTENKTDLPDNPIINTASPVPNIAMEYDVIFFSL